MLIVKKIFIIIISLFFLMCHAALTFQMALSFKSHNLHMIFYNLLGILTTSTFLVVGYNIFRNLEDNN